METGRFVTKGSLSQMWHGEHECITSEMTQIMKKSAVKWIAQ